MTPKAHAASSLPPKRKRWKRADWYLWVTQVTAKNYVKERLELVDYKYQSEVKRHVNKWWKQL